MMLRKIALGLLLLSLSLGFAHAQESAYLVETKVLFPSAEKSILQANGDSLLLFNTLPGHKELWLYRASTDTVEKFKAEVMYNSHPLAFANNQIAYYDVVLERFMFTKIVSGKLQYFIGNKYKASIGQPSIGVALPRFFFFNNQWLTIGLVNLVDMDNKLFYGVLDERGEWVSLPRSLFDYPAGLGRNLGLVKGFTSAWFNGRQLVCCEISGDHFMAKNYSRPKGMLVVTEFDGLLEKIKHIPIIDDFDDKIFSSPTPCAFDLVNMGDRLAIIVKSRTEVFAKLLDKNYHTIGNFPISIENIGTIKSSNSLAVKNGFVTVYATDKKIILAYLSKDGELIKDWLLHDNADYDTSYHCMHYENDICVVIKDSQKNEIIRKIIWLPNL